MPNSFWGAKTCFTKGGWWYLINFITLSLFDFVHSGEKNGSFGNLGSRGGGGGPLFPKVNVKILAKFLLFGENQKWSQGPKMQNKPWFFSLPNRGSQKGGGSAIWEKLPNNTVIFFSASQSHITCKLDLNKLMLSCQIVYIESSSTKGRRANADYEGGGVYEPPSWQT